MDWNDWLREDISLMYTRGSIIRTIIGSSIIPLLKQEGFVLGCSPEELGSMIASTLYEHGTKSFLSTPHLIHPYADAEFFEDYRSHYYSKMSYDKWNNVWKAWSCWVELTSDTMAMIEEICWMNINLSASPEIMAFDAGFEDEEDVIFVADE
jgi:hypothetical protein